MQEHNERLDMICFSYKRKSDPSVRPNRACICTHSLHSLTFLLGIHFPVLKHSDREYFPRVAKIRLRNDNKSPNVALIDLKNATEPVQPADTCVGGIYVPTGHIKEVYLF